SRLVLPAPDGPISATRSPCAMLRRTSLSARVPSAWVRPTPCTWILTLDSLQQAGVAGCLLDAVVVLWTGLDEAAGGLQVEDLLVLRVGRVECQEGGLDLLGQLRVEGAAHRPVVIEVGLGGGEDADLVGVDLAGGDQLVPHRGVQHASIDPAGSDPGHGGVMRAGVGDAAEVALRGDAVLQYEVARHQAAGGRGDRAEG